MCPGTPHRLAKVPTAVNITNEVRKTRYSDIPEKLLFV
jgi:hypothetical protein